MAESEKKECIQDDKGIRLALLGIFLTMGFSLLPVGYPVWGDISFAIRALVAIAFFAMGFIAFHNINVAYQYTGMVVGCFLVCAFLIWILYGMPKKGFSIVPYEMYLLMVGLLIAGMIKHFNR